jgi:hypothetical protein
MILSPRSCDSLNPRIRSTSSSRHVSRPSYGSSWPPADPLQAGDRAQAPVGRGGRRSRAPEPAARGRAATCPSLRRQGIAEVREGGDALARAVSRRGFAGPSALRRDDSQPRSQEIRHRRNALTSGGATADECSMAKRPSSGSRGKKARTLSSDEGGGLSARMRELLLRAKVEERRKPRDGDDTAAEKRRRTDRTARDEEPES